MLLKKHISLNKGKKQCGAGVINALFLGLQASDIFSKEFNQ